MKRKDNETTSQWLERLIEENASEAQLNAVRAILETENLQYSRFPGPPINMHSILLQHPADSISTALAESLPFKIPIYKVELLQNYSEIFTFGNWGGADLLHCWIDSHIHGSSEAALVSRDDRWIGVISHAISGIQIFRDQTDESSQKSFRPDVSLLVNGALFLKEGAKYEVVDIKRAAAELTDKFSSNAIQVFPFGCQSIIGITSSINLIQIHLLSYDATLNSYTESFLRSYDVQSQFQRVNYIIDIMKLMRWVVTIKGPNSQFHLCPGVRLKTPNGHHITWGKNGLLKEFYSSIDLAVMPRLVKVYEKKLPHVEWGSVVGLKSIQITRIGIRILDALKKELINSSLVVDHIRLALEELHSLGYAHCDISVKNVYFDSEMKCAFLDDLEYLTPIDSPPPNTNKYGHIPVSSLELDHIQFENFKLSILVY